MSLSDDIWFKEIMYKGFQLLVMPELHHSGNLHIRIFCKVEEDLFQHTIWGFDSKSKVKKDIQEITIDRLESSQKFVDSFDYFIELMKEKYKSNEK